MEFVTRCVEAELADLEGLEETKREVGYATARCRAGPALAELAKDLGYPWRMCYGGVRTLANDPCVRFYTGRFQGRPCVDVVWSQIDHVFC